ncbi:hypothetical protein HBI29_146180 [Parastagonospora nodorum]|nr:hypothetical protein HBI29_146180 [Parastagonospora nodorum]
MMPSSDSARPSKRLAIFCDGTWVGRETNVPGAPASNIRQLANMVGEVQYNGSNIEESAVHPLRVHSHVQSGSSSDSVIAGYQEGVGLNRTFLDYIWDGATASAIGDECIAVYKFIVENYTDEHEIWLFGFSRGAFTVRCVAGMINNCGIIKRLPEFTDDEVHRLCYDVFRTYRSALPNDGPHSDSSLKLKGDANHIWQVSRPIRFMGLIDTVGALGIPRLNAGIGFDWAPFEFFDQNMSSVVQEVYHAPCLHDRLWMFQPCLVYPGSGKDKTRVHQKWFPGTHYDVGRMTFRFVRQSPANWIEKVVGALPDLLSRTIFPNEVLSDCVLRFLLEGIRDVDSSSSNPLIPDIHDVISHLDKLITHPVPNSTGSGDIYGDVLNYAPGGILLGSLQRVGKAFTSTLNTVLPQLGSNIQDLLGIKAIIGILTATSDRRIPGGEEDVFAYAEEQVLFVEGVQESVIVAEKADMRGVNEWGKVRYESKTFENWVLWKRVFGGGELEVMNGNGNGEETNGKGEESNGGGDANGNGKKKNKKKTDKAGV